MWLGWAKFKRRMLKSTDCRENYKHCGYVTFGYHSKLIHIRNTQAEMDIKIAQFTLLSIVSGATPRERWWNQQTADRAESKRQNHYEEHYCSDYFLCVYRFRLASFPGSPRVRTKSGQGLGMRLGSDYFWWWECTHTCNSISTSEAPGAWVDLWSVCYCVWSIVPYSLYLSEQSKMTIVNVGEKYMCATLISC